jgi:hypothetical protein
VHPQRARDRALAAFSRHLEAHSGRITEAEVSAAKAELRQEMQAINQELQHDRWLWEVQPIQQRQQFYLRRAAAENAKAGKAAKAAEPESCNAGQCKGVTKRGERCRNSAKAGSKFCGRHTA